MIRAKLLGQASLARKLRNLKEAQRRAVGGAVQASLDDLQRDARRRLREASGSDATAGSVFLRRKTDKLGGAVATGDPRAVALELGTAGTPARPWLRPAFQSQKPQARRRVGQAMKSANRKAAI